MAIVIHNATIATVDDRDSVHYGAAIAIEAGRIAALGPSAEILARYRDAERVDGAGKLVLPGFANVHTHLTMTLARGVFEDLSPPHKPPFSGGLSPIPLPAMTPDERRAMALLANVKSMFPGVNTEGHRFWMGFRPSTPDSLPILGEASGRPGLFLAVGHGHFGMTGGPPSGRLLSRLINKQPADLDVSAYAPQRF